MALAVSRIPWQAEEAQMELDVHKAEELVFIHRVKGDSHRVIRLIEGGLLAEAHSTLGGLVHAANRRETQVTGDGAA